MLYENVPVSSVEINEFLMCDKSQNLLSYKAISVDYMDQDTAQNRYTKLSQSFIYYKRRLPIN